jgi:hypothetical protein
MTLRVFGLSDAYTNANNTAGRWQLVLARGRGGLAARVIIAEADLGESVENALRALCRATEGNTRLAHRPPLRGAERRPVTPESLAGILSGDSLAGEAGEGHLQILTAD